MWEVRNGDSVLLLVGHISGVPREINWRADALESATRRADRVLEPQVGRASLADVFRLIWRIRTVARLPAGRTTADYLTPEMQSRLEALMHNQGNSWRNSSFVSLSIDLMEDHAGYGRKRSQTANDVVKRVARQARIPVRHVGTVRGDELIDNLINDPPETYLPCLIAAIEAAEVGPQGDDERITAWRQRRVADVVDNPLEQALGQCWPWGDPQIAPLLRQQWVDAVNTSLTEPGVTMAVVQLRVLAERGGVLDRLEQAGLEIIGPEWK